MKSALVREKFLVFFESKAHRRVASSSLVPQNDETLMFINSGMAQFKDVFLGFEKRGYLRATTSQRCLRAGGKHNDLENVGFTVRHHTFFEMLGNFSFGDYFKELAIPYAWELLTSEQGYGIDPRNLWVTVFGGGRLFGGASDEVPADVQARDIWQKTLREAGFSAREAGRRVINIPTTDNFWMMGDTGPCGPCSEIFFNKNRDAKCFEGEDQEKADICVEIWNLVFMQFNRDAGGTLKPLPAPCVDTGMGLERLCAVLQNVPSNYDTDLLAPLVRAAREAVIETGGRAHGDEPSLRVIADHIRACSYLLADGVRPSNEDRGYVLRRIIRRALRHGYKLGARGVFFANLAGKLAEIMGGAHPVLPEKLAAVSSALAAEEEGFARTLHVGMGILDKAVSNTRSIAGETAFELYDTYGFPLDLTQDYARERGIDVDVDGFARCMSVQRKRSRKASTFKADRQVVLYAGPGTEFVRDSSSEDGEIAAIYAGNESVGAVGTGREAVLVLNRTPCYAEAGGQAGDTGAVAGPNGMARIIDTFRLRADVHGHRVIVEEGALSVGESVRASLDAERRSAICRAHSATHLLHAALTRVIGEHANQRGSHVVPDRLRFDFAHDAPVSPDEIAEVERIVNAQVCQNAEVVTEEISFAEALSRGAMALFGEKYGEIVRMVAIDPEYSLELCGGTHVPRAGGIGFVRLQSEEAVAAGVRRIFALTAGSAVVAGRELGGVAERISSSMKISVEKIEERLAQLQEMLREQGRALTEASAERAVANAARLVESAVRIDGVNMLVRAVGDADASSLKVMAARLGAELAPAAVMLGCASTGKAALAAFVDDSLTGRVHAGNWVRHCANVCGSRGGGRPGMAQAGGGDPGRLEDALAEAGNWLRKEVAGG